ncbi:hypothetical protein K2X30_10810 [bacterium]|nr:hypothetical protein [bacterium]
MKHRYVNNFERYFHPDNEENRNIYRKRVRLTFRIISTLIHPDLVISGSSFDSYVVELIVVAREMGVKWATCEREGTHSIGTAVGCGQIWKQYRAAEVDYVFTANDLHQQAYEIAAETSRTLKKIQIVGELRSDMWHPNFYKFNDLRYQEWNKFKKKILFLTFGEKNYIEPMVFPNIKSDWLPLLRSCEKEFLDFAKENPDILLFYKMGHVQDFHREFIDETVRLGLKNIVALDRQFPCEELIHYCDLIFGFQSTATIEAMFTDKPLFYLYWNIGADVNPDYDIMPLHKSGAVEVLDSPERMTSLLKLWNEGHYTVPPEQIAGRKTCREYYFVQPDGHVAERFLEVVKEVVGAPEPLRQSILSEVATK